MILVIASFRDLLIIRACIISTAMFGPPWSTFIHLPKQQCPPLAYIPEKKTSIPFGIAGHITTFPFKFLHLPERQFKHGTK